MAAVRRRTRGLGCSAAPRALAQSKAVVAIDFDGVNLARTWDRVGGVPDFSLARTWKGVGRVPDFSLARTWKGVGRVPDFSLARTW